MDLQYFRFVIPPLCLSTKLTSIHIELFGLATAIYPIILVVITCILMELHARNYRIIHILWKPISIPLKKLNITSVTSDALIHTFATFILLSAFSDIQCVPLSGLNIMSVEALMDNSTNMFCIMILPSLGSAARHSIWHNRNSSFSFF